MTRLLKPEKERAAALLAEGRFELQQVAAEIGVDVRTLHNWRSEAEFSARVDELTAELSQAAMRRGMARKEYRLGIIADLHSKLLSVIEARAREMSDVPGGETGLLVKKAIISAGNLVGYEYAVDTGIIRELRSLQERAARELGQVVEKHEHRMRSLKDLSDEELRALLAGFEGEDEQYAPGISDRDGGGDV